MTGHYFFPPASGYLLNKVLFLLKSDDAFRRRYLDDPMATMMEVGLDAAAQRALERLDRDRLVELGAHPYLVFMAELRLKMDREAGAFEYF